MPRRRDQVIGQEILADGRAFGEKMAEERDATSALGKIQRYQRVITRPEQVLLPTPAMQPLPEAAFIRRLRYERIMEILVVEHVQPNAAGTGHGGDKSLLEMQVLRAFGEVHQQDAFHRDSM